MENEQKYNRPSWDEYFMNIVKIIGERGTCDRGRSGCVITKDRRIIALQNSFRYKVGGPCELESGS